MATCHLSVLHFGLLDALSFFRWLEHNLTPTSFKQLMHVPACPSVAVGSAGKFAGTSAVMRCLRRWEGQYQLYGNDNQRGLTYMPGFSLQIVHRGHQKP